jgi:photosystem II stability/assembly factor-like uncharacterized protein
MPSRLWNRGIMGQFLRLALVGLLAAGLGWTWLAPAPAICGTPPTSAVGWVVGESADGYGVILHTTDGGAHWLRQGGAGEIPDVGLIGVSAVDQDYAWAAGGNADGYGVILRTTDGGAHWQRQGTAAQIPDVPTYDVYALNRDIAWVTGHDGLILHTTDGGRTWGRQGADVAPPVLLTGVYARDALNVWVVGLQSGTCGVILHSADGGASWQRQTYTPLPGIDGPNLLHVHGNLPHTVWVVGNGTVMRSTDDGATWEANRPGIGGTTDCNGIDALNDNTVWLSTDQGGIYLFDGSQWQQQPTSAGGYEIMRISALDGQTAWAVGGQIAPDEPPGVLLFKQEGQDWTSQAYDPAVKLVDVSFPRTQRERSLPAAYELLMQDGVPAAK